MARYQECGSSAQMLEDGNEMGQLPQAQTKAKQWRRLGLGLAVVGTIGTMVYSQMPKRRVTPMDHLAQLQRGIIAAFDDDGGDFPFATKISWMFSEEGGDSEPNAMGVDVHLQGAEEEYEGPMQVAFTFNSQEGKAKDLVAGFEDLKKALVALEEQQMGPEHSAMLDKMIQVSSDGDEVTVTVQLSDGVLPPSKKEVSFEGEKPKLHASLYFGRTLQEMWENKEESCATVYGGFHFKAHTSFAKKVLRAIAAYQPQVGFAWYIMHLGGHDEGWVGTVMYGAAKFMYGAGTAGQTLDDMPAIASLTSDLSLKYRKELYAKQAPPLQDAAKALSMQLASLPFEIRTKISALQDSADGLKTGKLQGLPDNWEVLLNFKDFHITPLLASLFAEVKETDYGFGMGSGFPPEESAASPEEPEELAAAGN